MTSSRFKYTGYILAYIGVLLVLLSPAYMYFSHDVEELKNNFPVGKTIQPTKPKSWVRLDQISSYGKWAIILSEDWGFYQHEGIDLEQIKVAINEMFESRKFRGASTITQQMVKNVYLSEERTLWRKLHEVILAQKVERSLSKRRILEIYLNVIEYGPGIYGIKQASYHYFKKHPSAMNPREAAFLAMLLPSPKRYYVSFKKKQLTPFAKERINAILLKMRMGKAITSEQYELFKSSKMSWEMP